MHYLILVAKGVVYGITHVVPGLGGGLVLILMGIYAQFVDALGNLLVRRDRWGEYFRFLVPLGIGMVLGMIALASVITWALGRYPAGTMVFFMGLLVGTIPPVLKMHRDMRPTLGRAAALILGLLLVVGLKSLDDRSGGVRGITDLPGVAYNTVISFLAGGATVTPGLDGSYVLLLGGTYEAVTVALSELRHLVIHWGALASTGIGAVLGIMGFSKLIDLAIRRAPSLSYYCVLGLIIGSVYGLWPQEPANMALVGLVVAFVAGLVLALVFGRNPEAGSEA